jgi:hypothetical protein
LRSTPESNGSSESDLGELLSWILQQLTVLAEAYGETLTVERAKIYMQVLVDIPKERLQASFERALHELKWFPKIAELRELAGAAPDERRKVEADAAWKYVNEYLQKWGVDRWPIYSAGRKLTAPPLEARADYALRQIGGLWRLNQITDESYPFMYRDFCEAYNLAPVADLMVPQLTEQFGERSLAGRLKELTQAKSMEGATQVRPKVVSQGSEEIEQLDTGGK